VLLSGLPETSCGLSDFVGQRLAAYSCGGSSGFAPASLLASRKRFPKNHDGSTYRHRGARVNSIARAGALCGCSQASTGRAKNFSRGIDTIVQIAPDVVVTVHHDATRGG
jgi:hypothetical protein